MFTDFGNYVVQHQMVEEWWRRRLADQIVHEHQIVESVVVWTDHAYLTVVISDHLAIVMIVLASNHLMLVAFLVILVLASS